MGSEGRNGPEGLESTKGGWDGGRKGSKSCRNSTEDRPGTGGEEKGKEERPTDAGQMWEEVGCLSMARGLPLPST